MSPGSNPEQPERPRDRREPALTCRRALADLPALVGGDLPLPMADPLRLHLQECWSCRREAAALQQARAALLAAAAAPVAGVDERFFSGLHRDIVAAVARVEPPQPRRWWVPTGFAAAAMLLLGGGFWLGNRSAGWEPFFARAPLAAPPAAGSGGPTEAVLPGATLGGWPRIELRNLGHDAAGEAFRGAPSGLAGRAWALRLLDGEVDAEVDAEDVGPGEPEHLRPGERADGEPAGVPMQIPVAPADAGRPDRRR